MKTEQEIRAAAKDAHEDLSRRYYEHQELHKEEFDRLHAKIWDDMEELLRTAGYIAQARNWRKEFSEAGSFQLQLEIIAEKLGLKGEE